MSFEKKLIALVRENKELYDYQSTGYGNKTKRDETWQIIGQILGQEAIVCKKRWRSLRDRYVREIKTVNVDRKEWQFKKMLDFIRVTVRSERDASSEPYEDVSGPKLKRKKNSDPLEMDDDPYFEDSDHDSEPYNSDNDTNPEPTVKQVKENEEDSALKDFFNNLQSLLNTRFLNQQDDDNEIMMRAIAYKMKPLPLEIKFSLQENFLHQINDKLRQYAGRTDQGEAGEEEETTQS